jgi:hypothetical protein
MPVIRNLKEQRTHEEMLRRGREDGIRVGTAPRVGPFRRPGVVTTYPMLRQRKPREAVASMIKVPGSKKRKENRRKKKESRNMD